MVVEPKLFGSALNETSLTQSRTTDYADNLVYENGALKQVLVPGGYYDKAAGKYYYYLTDHLGSARVVAEAGGAVLQQNHYDPYGATLAESTGGEKQPYRYNGKELESDWGLEQYDYLARSYDPVLGRFTTIDPLAEKYYSISPYAYCLNNPLRYIDPDGQAPGDFFRTKDAAAKDWGLYYNGASILRGKEFSSSIYSIKKNGKAGYTYTEANIGSNKGVSESDPPKGKSKKGIVHSHGKYESWAYNNFFSNDDKQIYYKNEIDGYLASPDGSLQKYDVWEGTVSILSQDMPSDPNDPKRKNKIDPVDIPRANKEKREKEDAEIAQKNIKEFLNRLDKFLNNMQK